MGILLSIESSVQASQAMYDESKIAFWALIVACISLAVSFGAVWQNRRINTTNLEAKYFEEIFREYIVNKIPECVAELRFENGRLNHAYKELNKIMMQMICDSKYYAYAKRDFYLQLQDMTIALEDKLLEQANEIVEDTDEQVKYIYGVHEEIMRIIKYINKNYHNF